MVHDDPLIRVVSNVATPSECRRLARLAAAELRPALVSGASRPVASRVRTAKAAWVRPGIDRVVDTITARLADLVGLPVAHAEALQIVRYGRGGEYRPHFDAYALDEARGRRYTRERGQRLWTALLYLNDVRIGGETAFPRLGITITPRQGCALIFQNVFRGTNQQHPLALHRGSPVAQGVKWIATLWFRERLR